jgi:dolichyl-phosphate beta-glucosyltransferase
MVKNKLSLVIPCFNEGKTIYKNIKKIAGYLPGRVDSFEIIAVNDGSLDDTLAELSRVQKEIPIKVLSFEKNKGKGKAVREGISAADPQSGLVMFLDADLGIPIEELEIFLDEMEKGTDLVIASRFVPGFRVLKPVLWYRKIMEKVFRLLRMLVLNNWNIRDTQCGFKVFRASIAKKVFAMSMIDRFAFDAEIIFIAKKFGYKITELPIRLQNPAISSVRLFFDPANMFLSLIKIRYWDLTGKYKWK